MSQCRSDLLILLNFSIYIYLKKLFLIDPHVKESMSETFDKSQMSETIDVPAG